MVEHLGREPRAVDVASRAAADAVTAGAGFNAAAEAARAAWNQTTGTRLAALPLPESTRKDAAITILVATLLLGIGAWFWGVGQVRVGCCGTADWAPYWLLGVPALLEVGGWTAFFLTRGPAFSRWTRAIALLTALVVAPLCFIVGILANLEIS